jgi:hypothetical protein
MVSEASLIKAVVAASLLLVASIVGSVAWGAKQVGEVRAEAEVAASALVEAVRLESSLVYALANAGSDRKALEDAYFQVTEAKNDITRVQASRAFAGIVNTEARELGLDAAGAAGVASDLTERVGALSRLNGELAAKRSAWEQRAHGFPGALAVMLRIQTAPPW